MRNRSVRISKVVGATGNSRMIGNSRASETGNVDSSGKTTKQTPKKTQQGAKQDPPKCRLCSKPHRYECDKFKALDEQDRWNKLLWPAVQHFVAWDLATAC